DGALGELDLADVVLCEHDLARRAGFALARDDERALLAPRGHAIAEPRRQPVAILRADEAGPVDDARIEERRDEVDQTGSADPERIRLADRVHVDIVVDRDTVDRATRAAHAVADLSALEGGARGRRARPHPCLRA